MRPKFFATPAKFRQWLAANHESAPELWVGFHKVHTRKASISWPQSVDAALCFGWIDGLRKSLGDDAYAIRFSPRRPTSVWSNVNTKRMGELGKLGLLHPKGLAAFKLRDAARSAKVYSPEARQIAFDTATEKAFRRHRAAWKFFNAQPPGYRRVVTRWVMNAKRDDTRAKRLAELIEDSARGRRAGVTTKYAKRR